MLFFYVKTYTVCINKVVQGGEFRVKSHERVHQPKTLIYLYLKDYTAVAKIIKTLIFSPAKIGFKSVISIVCCSVSVGNISLHFQKFILPFIFLLYANAK